MKTKIFYIVILSSIYATIFGCGKKNEVLVRIDGKAVTAKEIENKISALPERYREVIKGDKRKFLDELIVDELLYGEALRANVEKEKEVLELIEEAKKKIIIAKLLKEKVDDAISISDEEVENYYQNNQDKFRTPEVLRASHILLKTEKESSDALLELANGRNFEDLARSRSTDPTSQKGGDIGYFTKGQLDPDFEKACFAMEEGKISDVVKTKFGFHIIKLTEKKAQALENFEDVKERIKRNLLNDKRKKSFVSLIQKLKDRAKIDINENSPYFSKK